MPAYAYRLGLIFALIFLITGCMPRAGKKPAVSGPDIRVLIGSIYNKDTLLFTGDYRLKSEEAEYEFGSQNRSITIQTLPDGIQLYNRNRNLLYRNNLPIVLEPINAEGRFTFRGFTYAGTIILKSVENNTVDLINRLHLEAYLKGVVPA